MNYKFLLLVFSLCPLRAAADPGSIATSFWLGATATAFEYEEFDDQDNSLDHEEGLLPGLNAGVSVGNERWFVESGLLWSSGRVDYHSPEVNSDTDEQILNLEIIAGIPLFVSDGDRVSVVAGAGYRDWQRHIRSTPALSGLDETYRWYYGLLGLRGEHEFNSRTRIIANVQVTRTANPEIEVEFKENFADDVNLDLGEETAFKVSLAVQRQLRDGTSLWLSPWYERWDLGRSRAKNLYRDGVPAGTVWEPRSKTRNYGVSLGVRWQFGGS